MYDLIIIGSGPAGLSAAVYGKRAGFDTLVIEKSPMSGGQVLNTYEVDNYLGLPGINGFDLGTKFREHADKMGIPFAEAEVLHLDRPELQAAEDRPGQPAVRYTVHTDQGDFETKAILIATGAGHAKLNVPGEEKFSGKGVSYCATCDGAFYRNKTTAVIGGGDVAVEDAIFLARFCRKVYLIHRRNELRAARILQDRLMENPDIEILWDTVAEEIEGGDKVTGLALSNVKTGEKRHLDVDGVFIAVGIHPNTELFRESVACDEKGYIIAGEDGTTDRPGIFAAGDVRTKGLRQIITAVSDGANAITSVERYFLKN